MVRLDYGVNSFVSQIVKSKSTAPESEIKCHCSNDLTRMA